MRKLCSRFRQQGKANIWRGWRRRDCHSRATGHNRRQTDMHSVLHLGAGPLMRRTIVRLKEQGYRVFAVDRNPQSPAFAVADGSAPVDVADVAGVAEYARQIGAEVLLSVNDLGVMTAAR